MAAYLEIGNSWQSPRISFTLDLVQTDTTNEDRQSPRISFSLNLSQTDGISGPEKRTREDVTYDTDFEFCVISNNNNNGLNSIIGETLLPVAVADELFMDGKILPLINRPLDAQPVTIARHLSLEISRPCRSPVRSISSPPSKITSSCSGNVASKSLSPKTPNKRKEITFKLSNKESAPAENRITSSKVLDQDGSGNIVKQQTSPRKSPCPISRSCGTGGEMKGKCLFCSLLCSRIKSTAERKYKGAASKDTDPDVPGIVEGSKRLEARRISNKIQPDPRCLGELKPMKPRFKVEDVKEETKVKQTADRGKLGSPGFPAARMRGGMRGQPTTGKVGGNGRLVVRNLESSSSNAVKTPSLDSPPPGKPMAEGSLVVKANNSIGGEVKVSPVVNVSVCIGTAGGRWNGIGGLFGFFSKTKREKKLEAQSQPSAYNLHHSHATNTNRKK